MRSIVIEVRDPLHLAAAQNAARRLCREAGVGAEETFAAMTRILELGHSAFEDGARAGRLRLRPRPGPGRITVEISAES